jgi:hypothetical protein
MKSIGREKLYSSPRIYIGWPTVRFPELQTYGWFGIPFSWFDIYKNYIIK